MTADEAYREALRRIAEAERTNADLLDLGDLPLDRLPEELGRLTELRVLALGSSVPTSDGNKIIWQFNPARSNSRIQSVDCLQSLTMLVELDLSFCESLSDVMPLSNLANLRHLYLYSTSVRDVTPLSKLGNLQQLDLSYTQVTDVTPLGRLASLRDLKLWQTQTNDVRALGSLVDLRRLHFWNNPITDASPLGSLPHLEHLDLDGCASLTEFAPLRPMLGTLTSIYLRKCAFDDLPTEICGEQWNKNVLDAVRAHYADLDLAAAHDAELKVFILGNGGVGKTQLSRRLRGLPYDPTVPTTHGIQLGHVDMTIDEQTVRLNLWDFGGQDIYHGAHALFLRGQAIFLILWTPEHADRVYEEKGVTIRDRSLPYWLDYLRGLGDTGNPVLILQSHCDDAKQRRPQPELDVGDFAYHKFHEISPKTVWGLKTLQGILEEAVHVALKRRPAMKVGLGRIEARDRLRAMLEEPVERRKRLLTRAEFEALCADINRDKKKISDPAAVLEYLHRCGVVFHRQGMFSDQIILDQSWALDAIYTLFHREKTLPKLRRDGRFTRRDLEFLVWQKYGVEEQQVFLDMMVSCGICFRVRNLAKEREPAEWEYLAPELLPEWSGVQDQLFGRLRTEKPGAEATASYRFLHEGILRSFLSKLGEHARDAAVYWKYGCWFYEQKTQSQVLIQSAWDNDPKRPGAGRVTLQGWGTRPEEVLDHLLKALLAIPIGKPPEVTGLNREGAGALSLGGMRLEGKGMVTAPSPEPEQVAINALSVAAPPDLPNAGPREIFVSYAWGDNTPEGKRRHETVERLCAKLNEWGWRVLRDREVMRNGELVSDFMKRMAQGDRVMVILSDKYLHSPYCMTELSYVYEGASGDKAKFLKKVVPVVLEDARIDDWRGRRDYAQHWKKEYQDMEPSLGDLGMDDQHRFRLMRKWYANIGDMLSFIADQLAPRGFDAIVADDFRAMRELLDR